MVEGIGPKNPIMAIVGEAPEEQEIIHNEPFIGPSGQLLNSKLHLIGIGRHEVYITNVVKERPPKNNFKIFWDKNKPKKELLEWKEKLLQELDGIDCNVVVALGSNALWALTGHKEIGKYRGSIYQTTLPSGRKVKVIGTYHPTKVLRSWNLGATVSLDFIKAKKQSEFSELKIPLRDLKIKPPKQEVFDYVEKCIKAEIVSFDIETSPRAVECISLSYDPSSAMSIPLTVEYWGSVNILLEVLQAIGKCLKAPIIKVGQNITFDIQYLVRFFGILPSKPWHDTMVMQHSCYSELPKGLDFLASVYTDEPYYKDDLKVWMGNIKNESLLWTYNAKDAAVTLECYYELQKEMKSLGVVDTYNYSMSLADSLLFMMLRGVKVDKEKIAFYKKKYTKLLQEKQAKFKELYGNVNVNSPKQLLELLKRLKIKPPTKQGKPTTDEKAIEKLAKKHPALRLIVEIRQLGKLISTYLNAVIDPETGRLMFSLSATGTSTGRLSSSESSFWNGINIQNVPAKIRDIVIPETGMVFTEADLKGADAMIMAYLTQDPVLIKLFEEGKNVHIYTACQIIWPKLTEQELKEDKKLLESQGKYTKTKYFVAKKVRHGGNYLLSWKGLSEELEISAKEAKDLLQRFYDRSYGLREYHLQVEETLKKTRTIVSPLGRKRIFFDRFGNALLRKAVAYPPQEVVTRVLNLGILKVYSKICKKFKDVNLILQVHDSILLEHPPQLTGYIHSKLKELLKVPIEINNRKFSIDTEINTGKNWRDTK